MKSITIYSESQNIEAHAIQSLSYSFPDIVIDCFVRSDEELQRFSAHNGKTYNLSNEPLHLMFSSFALAVADCDVFIMVDNNDLLKYFTTKKDNKRL